MSGQRENLQHKAEHTRARRQSPLTGYMVILFAVAFLLLALAYCQQQRQNNQTTTDALKQSSSAVESLQKLIADNDALREQVAGLEEQLAQEQSSSQAAREQLQTQSDARKAQTDALVTLNQLRALYNKGKYQNAHALLSGLGEQGQSSVREQLTRIAEAMTPEQRQDYDPVAAWDQLVDWLD